MTAKEFYITGNYSVDHTTFGGVIYESDFETDYRGKDQKESSIARRIEADKRFDMQCMKNRNQKEKN